MTEQQLAELEALVAEVEALVDAATEGPWEASARCTGDWDIEPWMGGNLEGQFRDKADAAFIASARTAVPELITEVRRLRGEVRRLYDVMSEAGVSHD